MTTRPFATAGAIQRVASLRRVKVPIHFQTLHSCSGQMGRIRARDFLGWKKCKSIMTKKSYGTPRYTTVRCDVANDVRDAHGSSTRVLKRLHRKMTDVSTSRRRDRWSPSPRPRDIKFIFSLGRSKLSTHKSKFHR